MTSASDPSDRTPDDPDSPDPAEVLELYRRHRIADQAAYYRQRARTYELARRQAVTTAAILLVFSALFGALGAADAGHRSAWAFVAALLAAMAAAITTYEAAFGFERFSRQYKETFGALGIAESRVADAGAGDPGDVQALVTRVEAILRSEVETWSQIAADRDDEGSS